MGWIGWLVLGGAIVVIIYKDFINPTYSPISYKKSKSRYRSNDINEDTTSSNSYNDYNYDSSSDDD